MLMCMVHEPTLAGLDLNLLVVLRALLVECHVTRAAKTLGLSQSATSHALARLRELYGDPLLVRSGRGLTPTPRAVELLPQLERGLGELERGLRGPAPFDPRTTRASFRLGADDYAQAVTLGPLLSLVRAEAPGVDLKVVGHPGSVEQLEAGTLDLALLPRSDLPASLSRRKIYGDGFLCMLRAGHPALRGGRLSLERYLELGHLLVAPGGTPGSVVDTELARRGLSRRIVLQVSNFLMAPLVVSETDLVNTGPERLLRRLQARFPIALVPPPVRLPRFDFQLVWHARRDHDSAHRWMRDAFARAARSL